MNDMTLKAFCNELDAIEKEAGLGRNLMAGLAMTGALAGGVKAAPKLMKAAPAAAQVAKKPIAAPVIGRLSKQMADPDVASALSFR